MSAVALHIFIGGSFDGRHLEVSAERMGILLRPEQREESEDDSPSRSPKWEMYHRRTIETGGKIKDVFLLSTISERQARAMIDEDRAKYLYPDD